MSEIALSTTLKLLHSVYFYLQLPKSTIATVSDCSFFRSRSILRLTWGLNIEICNMFLKLKAFKNSFMTVNRSVDVLLRKHELKYFVSSKFFSEIQNLMCILICNYWTILFKNSSNSTTRSESHSISVFWNSSWKYFDRA